MFGICVFSCITDRIVASYAMLCGTGVKEKETNNIGSEKEITRYFEKVNKLTVVASLFSSIRSSGF